MDDAARPASAETGLDPRLTPISFAALAGWPADDHAAAFQAFRRSAQRLAEVAPKTRALGISGAALQSAGRAALACREDLPREAARAFFEAHFRPHRIDAAGFVTGYYEPEAPASLARTARFGTPLYRRPVDLVDVTDENRPSGWDPQTRFARRTATGLAPFFDRPAIEAGALAGRGLEIAWLESPVDAFFIHVQGSARLRLADGGTLRVSFDGKSGHPYTSIGRLAVERGLLPLEDAHKDGLEAWLRAHPEEGVRLMWENRSFIFFRSSPLGEADGPLGAAGVSLTAGRSLAVDRTLTTFHTPVWVEAAGLLDPTRPDGVEESGFGRLMMAQDTGSAIVGPARGDLFFGSGEAAGSAAGRVRHAAAMTLLIPVPLA